MDSSETSVPNVDSHHMPTGDCGLHLHQHIGCFAWVQSISLGCLYGDRNIAGSVHFIDGECQFRSVNLMGFTVKRAPSLMYIYMEGSRISKTEGGPAEIPGVAWDRGFVPVRESCETINGFVGNLFLYGNI